MFTHDSLTRRRRPLAVVVALASSLALVLAGALVDTAAADTPAAWEKAPPVSAFEYVLLLLLIPLGLAAVISLLAFLPTLAGDSGYQPGQTWGPDSEWFGGPRKGVAAADEVSPERLEASSRDTGGTSGGW